VLNPLKRFFWARPAFKIVQSATGTAEGDKPAVLLSAVLQSESGQEALVTALFEQFKIQRMLSPVDTDLMLITVVGPCDAPRFAESWRALVANDKVASVFMQRMVKADIGCTETGGFHSLLPVS
jgi:hypothetical protein